MKALLKSIRRSPVVNAGLTRTGKVVADLAPPLRDTLSARLPRTGFADAPLPNGARLRLWSAGDDVVANGVYWYGWTGLEDDTLPLFYERAQRAEVVLDVGAHVGHFSLVAAHANPGARVIAFEPFGRVFARLVRNVSENDVGNVECVRLALADRESAAPIFHNGGNGMPSGSSLRQDLCGHTASETIRMVRFDMLRSVLGIERVDLIKIDTEGTEPSVLRGMTATLAEHHPDIICEVLERTKTADELQGILEPLGYRFYHLDASGPRREESIAAHPPPHRNYLFTVEEL